MTIASENCLHGQFRSSCSFNSRIIEIPCVFLYTDRRSFKITYSQIRLLREDSQLSGVASKHSEIYMKLITFKQQGAEYLGAFTDTGIINLSIAAAEELAFSSMQNFIEAGQPALDRAYAILASSSARIPSDQVDWLAPLPLPAQIRDCLGFEEHLKNSFESAIKLSAMAANDPVETEHK